MTHSISTDIWKIVALYRFVEIKDTVHLQKTIKDACLELGICGTLLLAPEGINGTIAGPSNSIPRIVELLETLLEISNGEVKYSEADHKPFRHMKVRLKKEIVTLRQPQVDPTKSVGTYVDPKDWNDLVNDPDMIMLDTRNKYETAIGTFKGATDPETDVFTQFADYVEKNLDPKKNKKVAMFCTGGIRCEKASSYMLSKGFEEVYHLKGGILQYLEDVPEEESLWEGSCFLFDRRVGIEHGLKESAHLLCYGCRYPLEQVDLELESYEKGVSCKHCIDNLTPEKARAFRMRHQQFQKLADEKKQA
ncbi:MAG: rhodanese-related sulfurtransferase [Alphaproteobacteria bacterium]|nr:rhodanese-related sulfurtransferase [Alphaproteobacteria bacterium]